MIINFKKVNESKITVLLDCKKVGSINKVDGGWQYFPLGSKVGGEIFAKIDECKRSLYLAP